MSRIPLHIIIIIVSIVSCVKVYRVLGAFVGLVYLCSSPLFAYSRVVYFCCTLDRFVRSVSAYQADNIYFYQILSSYRANLCDKCPCVVICLSAGFSSSLPGCAGTGVASCLAGGSESWQGRSQISFARGECVSDHLLDGLPRVDMKSLTCGF